MLLELFYEIDNFCKAFLRSWKKFQITNGLAKRIKPGSLCLSEIMTIVMHFHFSGFRTFKDYYLKHVCQNLKREFPELVNYTRFVELMSGWRYCQKLCSEFILKKASSQKLIGQSFGFFDAQ